MQRKTVSCQLLHGRAITPVECEKSPGFSRGGDGHPAAINDGDGNAPLRQKVSKRCPDDAGATYDDLHSRTPRPEIVILIILRRSYLTSPFRGVACVGAIGSLPFAALWRL